MATNESGALLTLLLFAGSVQAQVTSDNILHASREPQNWLTYSGGYLSQRYSLLDKINRDNVKDLQLKWVYHPSPLASVGPEGGPNDKMEATPLVVNGIMYTVQGNDVVALDAASGRIFWTFTYEIPPESNAYVLVCKGLAISGNTVFWATYDGHLIAIDATSGKAIWNKTLVDWRQGYQLNVAPLIIKNMVVLGTADNERGANCWVAAYDVKTGKELWRFWTAPNSPTDAIAKTWGGDSYKYGGSPIWVTGSYDPETNLTFWGTGDPNPGWNGDSRPGDNLYADSVLALDADTGKLKWYYQFMPHDEFDLDSVQVPVLADIQWKGEPRKVMLWANRNGFFYVFDRTNGQFLMAKAFVKQNWNLGFDAKGRPIMAPGLAPKPEGAASGAARNTGRHELVFALLQPSHRIFLYLLPGITTQIIHPRATPVPGCRTSDTWERVVPFRHPKESAVCPPSSAPRRRDTGRCEPSMRKPARRSGTSKW